MLVRWPKIYTKDIAAHVQEVSKKERTVPLQLVQLVHERLTIVVVCENEARTTIQSDMICGSFLAPLPKMQVSGLGHPKHFRAFQVSGPGPKARGPGPGPN